MLILFELRIHCHSLTLCTIRFLEAQLQWSSRVMLELLDIYTALFILKLVPYYGLGLSDMEWSVIKSCVATSCHLCRSHKLTYMEFLQLQGMTAAACWGLQFTFAGEWIWSTPDTAGLTVTAFSLSYSLFTYLQPLVPTFSRKALPPYQRWFSTRISALELFATRFIPVNWK